MIHLFVLITLGLLTNLHGFPINNVSWYKYGIVFGILYHLLIYLFRKSHRLRQLLPEEIGKLYILVYQNKGPPSYQKKNDLAKILSDIFSLTSRESWILSSHILFDRQKYAYFCFLSL